MLANGLYLTTAPHHLHPAPAAATTLLAHAPDQGQGHDFAASAAAPVSVSEGDVTAQTSSVH